MPFAHMQHNGLFIAQMFFGLWLLPLGYLVLRSGYFPKVLGVLLIAACFSYLADLFALFPVPDFEASIAPFASTVETVAELSFMAWLLVKAVRVPAPDARVPTLAVHPSRSS